MQYQAPGGRAVVGLGVPVAAPLPVAAVMSVKLALIQAFWQQLLQCSGPWHMPSRLNPPSRLVFLPHARHAVLTPYHARPPALALVLCSVQPP